MHSRKLASRMGLETGWNTAISLADDCVGERLEWENFAQLPHGIQQIRTHLETQDNVPLLVHLFTHSYSLSVASNRRTDDHMLKMLDVMTEWKEGVMTLSNSSHTANTQLFKKVASKRNRHLGSFLHHDEPVRPLFGDARLGACERRNAGIVLSTEMKSLQDTYSFYTMDSLNKQIFHVNELLCSSGGWNLRTLGL